MKTFRASLLLTRPILAIAGFFVLCQVMGAMCTIPDLSMPGPEAIMAQDGMVCPMDGTIMCPPSAVSSPDRQAKNGSAIDLDHGPIVPIYSATMTTPSVLTQWSWSSAPPIVPISISSSSVLRI